MSSSNNDIYNAGGPGSSAEPSMEEILASIRRILKEDDTQEPAPVDIDDDILVLDPSMIVQPADLSTATMPPESLQPQVETTAAKPESVAEPMHFSSEPVPFAQDFYVPRPMTLPDPVMAEPTGAPEKVREAEPVAAEPPPSPPEPTSPFKWEPLPESAFDRYSTAPPEPVQTDPEPAVAAPVHKTSAEDAPALEAPVYIPAAAAAAPVPEAPIYVPPEPAAVAAPVDEAPVPEAPAPEAPLYVPPEPPAAAVEKAPADAPPADVAPARAAPTKASLTEPVAPAPAISAALPEILPDSNQAEPDMSDQNGQQNVQPPQGLMSDKVADAAASSIGAMVRSLSTDKSVAVNRTGLTIEDIVREEIRPLLKSWLDSHLPSLVERVVRSEIERVIDRSSV